jgi:hypothetical protein
MQIRRTCSLKREVTYINSLPNLQHSPSLSDPIAAQHTSPALKTVHLASGALEITLLEKNLGPGQSGLNIVSTGQSALALLGEHHLAENGAGSVRRNTSVLGQERSFADFRSHAAEAVNYVGWSGDTALVSGGVDGSDGGVDDVVALADFFQGDELVDKGSGVIGVQYGVANRLESDLQVLRAQGGVDDFAPGARKLLELGDGVGEVIDLGEAAIALLLDLGFDGLGEGLLEVDFLLEKSVLVLLFGDAAGGLKLGFETLVVLVAQPLALVLVLLTPLALSLAHLLFQAAYKLFGCAVELGVSILNLSLGIMSSSLLEGGNSSDDLLEIVLGAGNGGAQLASLRACVDGSNDVVDHLDKILNNRLSSLRNVDVVHSGDGWLRCSSRCRSRSRSCLGLILLCALHSLDLLLRGGFLGRALSNLRLRLRIGLGAHVRSLCTKITICSLRGQTAALANGNLVLSAHLGPVLDIDRTGRKTSAELAFLEVSHGILAAGDVLGEEVVEVVAVERVVDTAGVSESREDDESQEEAAEAAWLGLDRASWASRCGAIASGRKVAVVGRDILCGSSGCWRC